MLPQHPKPEDDCWWKHFTKEQHAALVHSLGNLALTYDNSSYSNHCFDKKRGQPLSPGVQESRCYAQATLKQEQLLAQYAQWTPEVIEQRQEIFAAWALKRWAVAAPTTDELTRDDIDIESEGSDEDMSTA